MTESAAHDQIEPESRRLCAFSGCRAPLPFASGPGTKARYCQDGKTWGPRKSTCKQAGHAEDLLASLRSDVPPPPVLADLADHVAHAIGPVQRLVDALTDVRSQLESDVASAHRDRDEALREATEERGLRAAAEAETHDANQRASLAEDSAAADRRARHDAEAAREAAEKARQAAENAHIRAEAHRADALDQAARAEARTEAAVESAEEANRQLAVVASELAMRQDQLDKQHQRADAERHRADRLAADYAAATAALRRDYEEQRERDRSQAAAEHQRLRADHDRASQAAASRHTQQLAEAHRLLGARERDLAEAVDRLGVVTARWSEHHDAIRSLLRQQSPLDEAALRARLTDLIS